MPASGKLALPLLGTLRVDGVLFCGCSARARMSKLQANSACD
jgi:hypothetical protein